jgi:hypothetical protein
MVEQSLMAHGDVPMGSEHVSETANTNIRGTLRLFVSHIAVVKRVFP